jgi:MFS transporter, VNT family, synaptic vesicle glycoprotein 2
MTLLLGLGNASDAVELTAVAFILPQFDEIDDDAKGLMSAGVFIGMLFGALFSGVLSDRYGRQPVLVVCLATNAVFGFTSSLAPTWAWLAATRVLSGLGVGGSAGLVFTMAAEFLPTERRGLMLTAIAWFWMFGSMFAAGAAWLLLGYAQVSWRWYAALAAMPAGVGALSCFILLPETPRYLYLHGERRRAYAVLARIARFNGQAAATIDAAFGDGNGDLEMTDADSQRLIRRRVSNEHGDLEEEERHAGGDDDGAAAVVDLDDSDDRLLLAKDEDKGDEEDDSDNNDNDESEWHKLLAVLPKLMHPNQRRITILLCLTWWAISFGWYGLTVWIPSLFDKLNFDVNIYESSFIVVAANLPGNALSSWLVDLIGRRRLLVGSMSAAGLVAIAFAFSESVSSIAYTLPVAMLFNALGTMGWNALDCQSAELFPTELRNTGMGVATAFGRLGSMTAQFSNAALINLSLPLMLSIIAGNVLVGAVAAFFLPESNGTRLGDQVLE